MDGLYHMEQPISETDHGECQKNKSVDHLLDFDRPIGPRSSSPGGRVQHPRIAGSSSYDNLNRPGGEAQKPVPICYDCYDHRHYSTD